MPMLIDLVKTEYSNENLNKEIVPIIITSYHRPRTFMKCVRSVAESTSQPIYVIDNSSGKLDSCLDIAHSDWGVRIIKNPVNIGKPSSIRLHWDKIPPSRWFITMDPDVVVGDRSIDSMIRRCDAMLELGYPVGLATPIITTDIRPEDQIRNKKLEMHIWSEMSTIFNNHTYINSTLAGCLMIVNTEFYINIGGFCGNKIYNDDDGWLCNQSVRNGLLNLLLTDIPCVHDRDEETSGYRQWKERNFNKQVDQAGYWD